MTTTTDPQRRPVLYDLRNRRLLADPAIGTNYVVIPSPVDGDTTIDLINTATSAVIQAARVVAASTSGAGVVQLLDSTSSTSTTTAATPNSVRSAYDLASAALPRGGGTMAGAILGDDSTSPAAPGYAFDGDADTGLMRLGANELGLVTGGVVRLSIDGGGNVSYGAYAALATNAIGVSVQAYDANTAKTNVVQSYSAAQRGTVSALGSVSAGTTTLNFASANNFSLTLPAGGTVTLATPANVSAGQSGAITITQNSSTAATVAYGTAWKFAGGAPSISSTLDSVSVIGYYAESASRITATLLPNSIS